MPGIVPTVMYCMRLNILWKKGEEKAGWVDGEEGGEKDRQVDG